MPFEFGSHEGAHHITSFRAFVDDNGMPGVRLTKDDGSFVVAVFSAHGIQELQKQLSKAQTLAGSFEKKH